MYYNPHKLLSRNGLYNFIVGNRGSGKTFSFKKWGVSSFLKTGKQFIYLRRFKTEIANMSNFFQDIQEFFPDNQLEVKGKKFYCDGKVCGYYMALSNALIMKSVNFKEVDKIGFDEFVIPKGHLHYLQDEVIKFLELYETIARTRDNVRVMFISNAVSIVNPYFLYWNLRPDNNKRFTSAMNGLIQIEFVRDEDFIEAKYKTKFGQLIKGTEYGNYAVENEFLVDNKHFIEKRTPNSRFVCSVTYMSHTYGFWIDFSEGRFYVSDKVDPSTKRNYVLTDSDHKPNMYLIKNRRNAHFIDQFVKAYENGYCFFENQTIKNQSMEMFKMLKG